MGMAFCCTGCLQALQRVPLFSGLDPKTKGAIASALGQVSMPKGTAVVTQVRGSVQTGGERARMQFSHWPCRRQC